MCSWLTPASGNREVQDAAEYFYRGLARSYQGDLDGAIADFSQAIKLVGAAGDKQRQAIAYNNRGEAWRRKGKHDKAIADFTKAIELKPDFAEAYYNRGNAWDDKGEYDRAIEDFTKAIELNPDDAEAYNNRGLAWRHKGEYDRAIEDYTKAIELEPDYAAAYNNRGNAWHDKGEYDKAIEDFTKAIELKPDLAQAYYNRGNAWANKGEYDRAIADYNEAVRLRALLPDKGAKAYCSRGIAKAVKDDLDGAIDDYTRAIELNSWDAVAHYNRGVARYSKGDFGGAIEDFGKAIKLVGAAGDKQKQAQAYYNRGKVRMDIGDLEGAIEDFTKAIKLNPQYAAAYNNRGIARAYKDDLDGAIEDFTKAIELSGAAGDKQKQAQAYYNRGKVRIDIGDLYGAIEDFTKAIELNPQDPAAYNNRGIAKEEQGDLDGAIEDYTKAIKLNLQDAKAYLHRGVARAKKGDLDGAIEDLTIAMELFKTVGDKQGLADAYTSRGVARAEKGDLNGATADYAEAIELNPQNVSAYYNRGDARAALGNSMGAIEDWKAAFDLGKAAGTPYGLKMCAIAGYHLGSTGLTIYFLESAKIAEQVCRQLPLRGESKRKCLLYGLLSVSSAGYFLLESKEKEDVRRALFEHLEMAFRGVGFTDADKLEFTQDVLRRYGLFWNNKVREKVIQKVEGVLRELPGLGRERKRRWCWGLLKALAAEFIRSPSKVKGLFSELSADVVQKVVNLGMEVVEEQGVSKEFPARELSDVLYFYLSEVEELEERGRQASELIDPDRLLRWIEALREHPGYGYWELRLKAAAVCRERISPLCEDIKTEFENLFAEYQAKGSGWDEEERVRNFRRWSAIAGDLIAASHFVLAVPRKWMKAFKGISLDEDMKRELFRYVLAAFDLRKDLLFYMEMGGGGEDVVMEVYDEKSICDSLIGYDGILLFSHIGRSLFGIYISKEPLTDVNQKSDTSRWTVPKPFLNELYVAFGHSIFPDEKLAQLLSNLRWAHGKYERLFSGEHEGLVIEEIREEIGEDAVGSPEEVYAMLLKTMRNALKKISEGIGLNEVGKLMRGKSVSIIPDGLLFEIPFSVLPLVENGKAEGDTRTEARAWAFSGFLPGKKKKRTDNRKPQFFIDAIGGYTINVNLAQFQRSLRESQSQIVKPLTVIVTVPDDSQDLRNTKLNSARDDWRDGYGTGDNNWQVIGVRVRKDIEGIRERIFCVDVLCHHDEEHPPSILGEIPQNGLLTFWACDVRGRLKRGAFEGTLRRLLARSFNLVTPAFSLLLVGGGSTTDFAAEFHDETYERIVQERIKGRQSIFLPRIFAETLKRIKRDFVDEQSDATLSPDNPWPWDLFWGNVNLYGSGYLPFPAT